MPDAPPLPSLLSRAGVTPGNVAPRFGHLDFTSTRGVRFPIFNEVMTQPLRTPYRAGLLAQRFWQSSDNSYETLVMTGAVAGLSASVRRGTVCHPLNRADF